MTAQAWRTVLPRMFGYGLSGSRLLPTESCWSCACGAKRYLLTDDVLKLQEFQQKKVAVISQIYGEKDLYFRNLEEKLKKNVLILRDELKTLLHLCQTPAEVELAKNVIYRYHAENKNVAFGEFKFGPLFIRLCYELNLENMALDLIKDKELKGFFSDCTSFNILMDMAFSKGHYERALEVLIEMKNQRIKFSKDTYMLAFATCYKLNSTESRKICSLLLEESELKGDYIPRQAYCFAIAFALKQNDISNARTIYSKMTSTETRVCSNLDILIHALSGTLQNVLYILEAAIETVTPKFVKRLQFSEQVLATVREKMSNDPVLHYQFNDIYTRLQLSGQVTPLTLDDMLCQTPGARKHHILLLNQRKISRRTFQPLHSALLAE
ncbi:pentatricopeptide repeat-containing protein 2, mitochondrial [Microcaecilia unicolor]|uniref:Pentatricopeptide repeat-containing protein 2, mitochondrial n=1 Tax=Microcaecilia unicolor TaxID=1415580 RepID=A0A6P7X0U7_9AMPH|nr:pentatricopeptide repeat-containing protein 2, mitochondrial-like [Microcaecilia unicolor]